jgi:predicted Zn-dependent peptidase
MLLASFNQASSDKGRTMTIDNIQKWGTGYRGWFTAAAVDGAIDALTQTLTMQSMSFDSVKGRGFTAMDPTKLNTEQLLAAIQSVDAQDVSSIMQHYFSESPTVFESSVTTFS